MDTPATGLGPRPLAPPAEPARSALPAAAGDALRDALEILAALTNPLAVRALTLLIEHGLAETDILSARLQLNVRSTLRVVGRLRGAGLVGSAGTVWNAAPERTGHVLAAYARTTPLGRAVEPHPRLSSCVRFGRLSHRPADPALRGLLLECVAAVLPTWRKASESDVNAALSNLADDVTRLRRELVDHGLVLRTLDGGSYSTPTVAQT